MRFIADFHIHSHFSRATSANLTPEHLDLWARMKGIDLVGTGDCVHPGWLDELRAKVEPADGGFFRLKPEHRLAEARSGREPRFMLTTEISNIYKKGGKVRKVHHVCVFPDLDTVAKVQTRLEKIGNIRSDGRPILGLDSKNLLEIVLESSPLSYLIPAHIWTPWFAVLGSKSGFDSIEECFDDLSGEIFAVETGLSSDPPMNRSCSFLDKFLLVSNSDAHSPEKLGREANLFETDFSYEGVLRALRTRNGFAGTIEFFPEEGKYHFDGHRACRVRWHPRETLERNGLCSCCGKPVTLGVMHRVAELADRHDPAAIPRDKDFWSITPLCELLSEIERTGPASKRVRQSYFRIVNEIGSEFETLLFKSEDELRSRGGEVLAEGVARLRRGEIIVEGGYDGEFGKIRVFRPGELGSETSTFFAMTRPQESAAPSAFDIEAFQKRKRGHDLPRRPPSAEQSEWTAAQLEAVNASGGHVLIVAGPGSGKTRVLTERLARLLEAAPASRILALTFTRSAVEEIRRRIRDRTPGKDSEPRVSTFHALGLEILMPHAGIFGRAPGFRILDEREREAALDRLFADEKRKVSRRRALEAARVSGADSADLDRYDAALREANAFDLDDLILKPLLLLRDHPEAAAWRDRFAHILVDEFQDLSAPQYDLLRLLAGAGTFVFAIGDPDQAIYGFRGSDPRIFSRFENDFPGLTRIALDRSFRCPARVIDAATRLMERETDIEGEGESVEIDFSSHETDRAEADAVAARIERMIGGVREFSRDSGMSDGEAADGIASFGDFAVLLRSARLFAPFVDAFHDHGIPFQVVGEKPFHETEPYRSAIDALAADPGRSPLEHFAPILGDEALDALDRRRLRELIEPWGGDAAGFLRALVLRSPVDDRDARAERVSLMTIHAAKGLEFAAVFVPACEEKILPFTLFGERNDEDLAEEKRLFYVALTRTKRYLSVSRAARRRWKKRLLENAPSRFLAPIDSVLSSTARAPRKIRKGDLQLSFFEH